MPTAKGVAPTVTLDDALAFQSVVLEFYRLNGRDFQWRRTRDPWSILVSEVMLQQTQTHRVAPKFESWMKRFPDAESLANASVAEVYDAWRGLGYNSRGLRLRESAAACVRDYGGQPPADERSLLGLPGVGRYTARAVLAFAFNIPGIVIETNIRTALILHFFKGHDRVSEKDLEHVAGVVLDTSNPRTWYYALMDYGSWLKKHEPSQARKAAVYARQSRFEGSVRQVRGVLLRTLADRGPVNLADMAAESGIEYSRVRAAAEGLASDGMIILGNDGASFPGD